MHTGPPLSFPLPSQPGPVHRLSLPQLLVIVSDSGVKIQYMLAWIQNLGQIPCYKFWKQCELKGYLQHFTSRSYTFCEICHLQRSLAAKILGTIHYLRQGGGWVIGGGLQFFLKKLGVGMLNMRSGGLQTFVQKIGDLVSFGYYKKKKKRLLYYNDIDKRSGELSGPSDLCSTFRSLAVAFGRTFTLD